jgi:hypothetical protein
MLYALRLHLPDKYPVSMQFPGRRLSSSDAPDNNPKAYRIGKPQSACG